jgi:hypothetical protein
MCWMAVWMALPATGMTLLWCMVQLVCEALPACSIVGLCQLAMRWWKLCECSGDAKLESKSYGRRLATARQMRLDTSQGPPPASLRKF